MQNDLISRSALIEVLNKWADANAERGYDTAYDLVQECIEVVKERPAAYDVEKVVAELEEQIDNNRGWEDEDYYWGETKGYEHAIEIVRNGGKE